MEPADSLMTDKTYDLSVPSNQPATTLINEVSESRRSSLSLDTKPTTPSKDANNVNSFHDSHLNLHMHQQQQVNESTNNIGNNHYKETPTINSSSTANKRPSIPLSDDEFRSNSKQDKEVSFISKKKS